MVSNNPLNSSEMILGKNRTEHSKAADVTWLVDSPPLWRQQAFVRILPGPKDCITNLEQALADLHEEVQISY